MSIQFEASDDRGKRYHLVPMERQISGYFDGMPEYNDPSIEDLIGDADRQLELIHRYEDEEGLPRKAMRKAVDWALSGPGTLATGTVVAYEAYSHSVGGPEQVGLIASTVGLAIGGIMLHEFFRRPFVGARSFYHAWRNPFSPAAQSNERIRAQILDT